MGRLKGKSLGIVSMRLKMWCSVAMIMMSITARTLYTRAMAEGWTMTLLYICFLSLSICHGEIHVGIVPVLLLWRSL